MKKIFLFGAVALIVLILITVILVLLGIVFFLLAEENSNSLNLNSLSNNSLINNPDSVNSGSANTGSPIPNANDLWSTITLPFVEKSCLSAAKDQAGDFALAVSSCSCSETQTAFEKNYSCVVSALDGEHSLDIDCVKDRGNCNITSEQGTFVFTFEELYQLVS